MTQVKAATGEASRKLFLAPSTSGPNVNMQNMDHLVDVTPGEASNDVPDEEEAGDPGAAVEVYLYDVPGSGAIHHLGYGHSGIVWYGMVYLGYGHAGEGHPATHHGGAQGDGHGRKDLAVEDMELEKVVRRRLASLS